MRELLVLLPIFVMASCVSAEDPGCVSDSECYAGRVCVEGRCEGEAAVNNVSSNNVSSNNVSSNNVSTNNVSNNVSSNNVSSNNVSPNNTPPPLLCMIASECPEAQVCTGDYLDPSPLFCVEPWACELVTLDTAPGVCVAEFVCDQGPYTVGCQFGDVDRGDCYCLNADGTIHDFELARFDCEDPAQLFEVANTHCSSRLPRF